MAQTALTEQQLLQIVHTLYEGNTSYPAVTDDDYLSRRNLGNDAILMWDMHQGTLWNELWTTLASASDGAKTIQTATTTYACPSDFRFMAGYLRIIDSTGGATFYTKIKNEQMDIYDGRTGNFFYVTGNQRTGYSINFLPGAGSTTFPAASIVGQTIHYEYYKRPSQLASPSDIPELSNPEYLIHYILSYLYRQDDNEAAYNEEQAIANRMLMDMRAINTMASWRENDHILSAFDDQNLSGFGK